LADAVVRAKATGYETATDETGRFQLTGLPADAAVFVTAWSPGYYINGVEGVRPGDTDVEITLLSHHDTDNSDYDWLPSMRAAGEGENQGCTECHSREGTDLSFPLPVDEWLLDAHSQSAVNQRFLTMYAGTDVEGNQSPPTHFVYSRDYGSLPLRPDPSQPYYGPGYKLDFPDTAGNCGACHTPAAAIDSPYSVDPTTVSGVAAEGIPCDFCHKVWDVRLDPASGLPQDNMPGVLSYEFRRPPEGHQFFAGPLDDVAPGEDTLTPIQRQSQWCGPCHRGIFWNTVVYDSFGEWLASPYSDPESGRTCQDCHMPPLGVTYFARPDQGGVERDSQTIFSHLMPGASSADLLQAAVSMDASATRSGDGLAVSVTLVNDQTGHHVPTDSPLRQMILLVQTQGPGGITLSQMTGPTIPEYGGLGDPDQGYYAGLPGVIYAKLLMELWTEISPTGAYWNPTQIVSDNRLAAFEKDTNTFTFDASGIPEADEITVTVSLLYRRAFKELMDQKGWDVSDIVMEYERLQVP